MVCIHCGADTQVINSRPQKRSNQVWRRRQCTVCQAIFSTREVAQYDAAWLVRSPAGGLVPFSRDKLFLSLYRSCQHRLTALADAAALTETVTVKVLNQIVGGVLDSRTLLQIIQVSLNRFDRAASVHYAAFHKEKA
jgi:transcriptional regulator NrdR family protein